MRLSPVALRAALPAPLCARALLQRSRGPLVSSLSQSPYRASISYRGISTTAARLGDEAGERKWSTPLAERLAAAIDATEPMPLARYMRMCLTSDMGGYYTRGDLKEGHDQFGVKGDFVTSPEISQIFGELIGIWFIAEWMSQGRPSKGVEVIEVGPGRGTLMDDMLRTIQRYPMAPAIDAIYMVEASAHLRNVQKNLLCGADAQVSESKVGYHSICKRTGVPIVWAQTIESIPKDPTKMPFIVAHEFFDALPIHAFQAVKVTPPTPPPPPPSSEGTTPAPPPSPPAKPSIQWREMVVTPVPAQPDLNATNPEPEFQMSLANSSTRHSRYLPDSSPRFRRLKSVPDAVIEVCPDAALYATDFATRIGGSAKHPKQTPSGAALILDYGTTDTVPINSLRGIRHHRLVSPFSEPGLVDLSADVDFPAVAEAAIRASEGVEVHGPVTQAEFLGRMGVRERAEQLVKAAGPERGPVVEQAWRRLVDGGVGGMGKLYKAMAILPENEGKRRPVGFGGDVE
ncbi:related to DUF185 domain protein [Cephalotrichum gorgonifer]|uniref:Protein arginine methyltransferase NDUFAF7 n=1 Tax=Cephalotrichum gorgonifer TaxID=2041049 RepID=A0AAE8MXM5_9PEZI|nr:related to DUF185 domain protein [Cephalotrichum gorgonifer]